MKDSAVLSDKYFGNLTIKGIHEIELGGDVSLIPSTWGWVALLIGILLTLLYKYYKRQKFLSENSYIFEFVSKLENERADEVVIYKMIKIIAKKRFSLSSATNSKTIESLDPESNYFEKGLDDLFFEAVYKSNSFEDSKLVGIKEQTLKWMRSLIK